MKFLIVFTILSSFIALAKGDCTSTSLTVDINANAKNIQRQEAFPVGTDYCVNLIIQIQKGKSKFILIFEIFPNVASGSE